MLHLGNFSFLHSELTNEGHDAYDVLTSKKSYLMILNETFKDI